MTEMYSANNEYVDIHGRNLSVLMRSDGQVFVPLTEIRKTGFHILSKSDYRRLCVDKSVVLNELRLYLLGAAKEFLIQKDVSIITKEDLNKSIDECCDSLVANDEPLEVNKSPSGVYGRQLLLNPKDVRPTQLIINRTDYSSNNDILRKNDSRYNGTASVLRFPQDNDISKQTRSNPHFAKKKQSINGSNSNLNEKNFQNNTNQMSGKNTQYSESRSASENEEAYQNIKTWELNVMRIELQPVMQDVKIVHIEINNEKLKYWVQLVENDKIVMNILEKCLEFGDNAPIVEPKLNQICLAFKDDLWYRVIVSRIRPKLKVHFLDFGNDAIVNEVRKIPDNLKSIPAQAVRIVLSRPEGANQEVLEMDDVLTVKHVKKFLDGTHVVQKENKNANRTPSQKLSEPIMINEIKYVKTFQDKEFVKIINYSNGKLYLRNKEHHEKLVAVDMEIKDLIREKVYNDVIPNQLVLCTKEGSEEKLCRAIVKKTEKDCVYVHFMDYHKEEKVPKTSLYAVSKTIANMPSTLIEIPFKGYTTSKFNANSKTMLEDMIQASVKFVVDKTGSEVDLLLKDKSLSDILFPNNLKEYPAQHSNSTNLVSTSSVSAEQKKKCDDMYERVMYEDMKSYEAPMGMGDYMMTNYKDATEFTVTSTNDEQSDMLNKCSAIEVSDVEPYEPEETEMVLAYFEGGWYRALIFEKCDNGIYQVLFVEYGNIAEVSKEDIRRFPKDMKDIPILGLLCQLKVKNTDEVRKRLEELLKPDNIYEMKFLSYSPESLQYTVEIPKITEILRHEGLI